MGITLGVLADTHIPDRARRLNPGLLQAFRQAKVSAILHAGDVSVPGVLRELEEIAPVHAVRGNRDVFQLSHLPTSLSLDFEGVSLVLTHGHGRLPQYLSDKVRYIFSGLQEGRYCRRLLRAFPKAEVIVFGHIHLPLVERWQGALLFNPGSACCPERGIRAPSAGLITIGITRFGAKSGVFRRASPAQTSPSSHQLRKSYTIKNKGRVEAEVFYLD